MIGLYIALAILGLLILIIILKALTFKDKTNLKQAVEKEVDDTVVNELCTLLKFKTVSHIDSALTDFSVFQDYINKVKEMYPLVFSKCEFTQTKEYAIKLKLKGESSEKPTVLMSHYDVVPTTEGWKHDPYLGEVVDGSVYGRGAVDTKSTMVCALRALENALNRKVDKAQICLVGKNWELVEL